jgi:hypothetical protein
MPIKPETSLGKWSVGLITIFLLSLTILRLLILSGQRGGEQFFDNLSLAIPGLCAAAAGTAAFFTGLGGLLKSNERSLLTLLATTVGLFVFLFCLGEILFPH